MMFYLERSSIALVLLNEFLVRFNVLSGRFLVNRPPDAIRLSLEMGFFYRLIFNNFYRLFRISF